MPDRVDEQVLERVKGLVKTLGTQKEAAAKTGIPYATLQRILAGKGPLTLDRVGKIAAAANVPPETILGGEVGAPEKSMRHRNRPADDANIISLRALNIKAAAGDGSLAEGGRLGAGPFHFSEHWLRNRFGSVAGLRMVQIKGDSQEPDLHAGDWVMIDEGRNQIENGLAVLLLDDCLMIKRLQREGHVLKLFSRNEHYPPIEVDLIVDEYRVRVIGRAVFVMKAP